MALELDDGEFWLPSEFLTDDDLLTDFKFTGRDRLETRAGYDFSLGFGNSGLSSPGESVTETESDEDDVINGLTRKLAQSTVNDSSFYTAKGLKHPGSPQSILSGSRRGNSSPPEPKDVGWDLLYAAAGEVARMRFIEETTAFAHPPARKPSPPAEFYPNRAQIQARLAYLQLQAAQLQRMKEQQELLKYQFQYRKSLTPERSQGLSMAAWPTLQQSQQNHHHRPQQSRQVFPSGNERTGTGVFLPRRIGTEPSPIRKKPELNQRSYIQQTAMNQEFRLPKEWSY